MKITVSVPIRKTFRTAQLEGMFDVPAEERCIQTFEFQDPPINDNDWHIGLIVGPSGSGKSTAAKHLFGNALYRSGNWNDDAVADNFGDLSLQKITQLLTLTGFSSPPSWLKPYRVLSNGEQFRCDLAKALSLGNLAVFDEYTSVVDRNVARCCSAALAKGIKNKTVNCKFVAVTCHYDIMDWLEPDWVLDTADGTVSRRLLRRPSLVLNVVECPHDLWQTFKKHHYLSASLSPTAKCYAALYEEQPVAFCAVLPLQGFKNRYRVSRLAVLPDYQGIGIGSHFLEAVADIYFCDKKRFSITAAHPSVIAHCKRSTKWKTVNVQKLNRYGRATVSFEYIVTND